MNLALNPPPEVAVAERYRRKGYEVNLRPRRSDLPDEVAGYLPDLIVTGDGIKIAVEIKSSATGAAGEQLIRIAELFREIPGWRFDYVILPTPGAKGELPAFLTPSDRERRLAVAVELAREGEFDGAMLLLWTVFEAVVQQWAGGDERRIRMEPRRLANEAVVLALAEDEDWPVLERLVTVRNGVIHGRRMADLSREEFETAQTLVRRVIEASSDGGGDSLGNTTGLSQISSPEPDPAGRLPNAEAFFDRVERQYDRRNVESIRKIAYGAEGLGAVLIPGRSQLMVRLPDPRDEKNRIALFEMTPDGKVYFKDLRGSLTASGYKESIGKSMIEEMAKLFDVTLEEASWKRPDSVIRRNDLPVSKVAANSRQFFRIISRFVAAVNESFEADAAENE